MLENALESFSNCLFQFISGTNKPEKSLLVKKHTENIETLGDFSFPNTVKSWQSFIELGDASGGSNETVMNCIGKEAKDIVQESKNWMLTVNKVREEKGRLHVFLDRNKAIQVGLLEALSNNEIIAKCIQEGPFPVQIDPLCEESNCLTYLRLKCLSKSIENLYAVSSQCKENAPKLIVSSKSSRKSDVGRMILCGTVLNAKTGAKETTVNTEEFLRLRQDEMTLIAQHKYGVRVSTDCKWREFLAHLGESAVVFELLQTKPSSAVKINLNCSAVGSSKGAAFILYNCARVASILKTFNEKVDDNIYPPLPAFENTDFTLLTHEDEWLLIFNYILGLPSLLKNCVELNDKYCEFRPHHICSYLCSMVRVFSQYYRRVRILTEPRQHLLPVLFARIHLLIIFNETLKTCLKILNIRSVTQM